MFFHHQTILLLLLEPGLQLGKRAASVGDLVLFNLVHFGEPGGC